MKEAFDLIKKRLEHRRGIASRDEYECGSKLDKNYYQGVSYGYYKAIEIVNQVAEEYSHRNHDLDIEASHSNDGWIPCSERLPEDDRKKYIVQKTSGSINILGFTKDAYKLSRYDFSEYMGKKKPIFYDYDSEYGYIELYCEAWQPLPEPFKPKGE